MTVTTSQGHSSSIMFPVSVNFYLILFRLCMVCYWHRLICVMLLLMFARLKGDNHALSILTKITVIFGFSFSDFSARSLNFCMIIPSDELCVYRSFLMTCFEVTGAWENCTKYFLSVFLFDEVLSVCEIVEYVNKITAVCLLWIWPVFDGRRFAHLEI